MIDTAQDRIRVYCAGPLFNRSERQEMTRAAELLEEAGFTVYLPHRDGMEFRLVLDVLVERGWDRAQAAAFLHESIFALDVYQLVAECGAMVWNLNGRVPDEGAVSEAAIAWTLGKPLVAWQDDVRSLIAGRVNPLLVGLVDFEPVERLERIPAALRRALAEGRPVATNVEALAPRLQRAVDAGERLWRVLNETHAIRDDALIADAVEELFSPRNAERAATNGR